MSSTALAMVEVNALLYSQLVVVIGVRGDDVVVGVE